ncbi:uncharacterized protein DS421_20g689560 [Arachis hypogaea]|nr:uncharacterized protein DS421_20g689560 [Arachis hypogaea]
MIQKIYDYWTVKRLQQMMSDVRWRRDHLTSWIRLAIKKELEAYFANDEGFKHCHLTSIANRASPRLSKYTNRLATFKSRLSKSLDREVILAKTFKYTHTLKANKERFADERSATYYRLEAATQQSQPPSGDDDADSETSVLDPNRVWRQTAFEPHKNCLFGLESFFASGLRFSTLAASSVSTSATSPADPQEVVT